MRVMALPQPVTIGHSVIRWASLIISKSRQNNHDAYGIQQSLHGELALHPYSNFDQLQYALMHLDQR